VSGDDPQLTNARTPTAHETTHVTGSDQIPSASSSARGLLTQLTGNATDYVGGDNSCHNVVGAVLTPNSITTAMIQAGAVTGAKIAGATITESNIVGGTITNASLAAGVAIANLGFTPLNKAGDLTQDPAKFTFNKNQGLAANSWSNAPILIQSSIAGARPQIGFDDGGAGAAAALYFEGSTHTFRYIDSAGNIYPFFTTYDLIPAGNLASGAAVTNIGYTPINKAGDNMNGSFSVGSTVGASSKFTVSNETGLAAGSWSSSRFVIQCAGTGARPGIGFNSGGEGLACYLYFSGSKFHFIDAAGTDHLITSS
jgi:hypothetical protein